MRVQVPLSPLNYMTPSEEARDKLKYWSWIDRARKVGFNIPSHWFKYGEPSNNPTEIINVNLEAISDKLKTLFERDDYFYKAIKRR